MINQRRIKRFNLKLKALIEVLKGDPSNGQLKMETANVSSAGAYLKTNQPLPIGTELRIKLVLSLNKLQELKGANALIHFNGSVIRSDEDGIGVCFDDECRIQSLPENR